MRPPLPNWLAWTAFELPTTYCPSADTSTPKAEPGKSSEVDSGSSAARKVPSMVDELTTDRVKYQRLLETSIGDMNHISSRITGGVHDPAESVVEALRVRIGPLEPPGDEVLIGISIIGDGWFDKGIGPLYNRIVFTKKHAVNRKTLIIYCPVCANELVPAYKEFFSLTVECGGGSIDKSDV
jgi:hypothetical protein